MESCLEILIQQKRLALLFIFELHTLLLSEHIEIIVGSQADRFILYNSFTPNKNFWKRNSPWTLQREICMNIQCYSEPTNWVKILEAGLVELDPFSCNPMI